MIKAQRFSGRRQMKEEERKRMRDVAVDIVNDVAEKYIAYSDLKPFLTELTAIREHLEEQAKEKKRRSELLAEFIKQSEKLRKFLKSEEEVKNGKKPCEFLKINRVDEFWDNVGEIAKVLGFKGILRIPPSHQTTPLSYILRAYPRVLEAYETYQETLANLQKKDWEKELDEILDWDTIFTRARREIFFLMWKTPPSKESPSYQLFEKKIDLQKKVRTKVLEAMMPIYRKHIERQVEESSDSVILEEDFYEFRDNAGDYRTRSLARLWVYRTWPDTFIGKAWFGSRKYEILTSIGNIPSWDLFSELMTSDTDLEDYTYITGLWDWLYSLECELASKSYIKNIRESAKPHGWIKEQINKEALSYISRHIQEIVGIPSDKLSNIWEESKKEIRRKSRPKKKKKGRGR